MVRLQTKESELHRSKGFFNIFNTTLFSQANGGADPGIPGGYGGLLQMGSNERIQTRAHLVLSTPKGGQFHILVSSPTSTHTLKRSSECLV